MKCISGLNKKKEYLVISLNSDWLFYQTCFQPDYLPKYLHFLFQLVAALNLKDLPQDDTRDFKPSRIEYVEKLLYLLVSAYLRKHHESLAEEFDPKEKSCWILTSTVSVLMTQVIPILP